MTTEFAALYECPPCFARFTLLATGEWDGEPASPPWIRFAPRDLPGGGETPSDSADPEDATMFDELPNRMPRSLCQLLDVRDLARAGLFDGDGERIAEVEILDPSRPDDSPLTTVSAEIEGSDAVLRLGDLRIAAKGRPGLRGLYWSLKCPSCWEPRRKLFRPACPTADWKCGKCWKISYPSQGTDRRVMSMFGRGNTTVAKVP